MLETDPWSRSHYQRFFLIVFGLPFLLVGLYAMFGPWVSGPKTDLQFKLLLFVCGFPFAAFGAWAMFRRHGIIIDSQSKRVTRWWAILIPITRKEYPLSSFEHVKIENVLVGGSRSSSRIIYAVGLAGKDTRDVGIESFEEFADARRMAEQLAKYCRIGVADYREDKVEVRSFEELDKSIRDRELRIPASILKSKKPKKTVSRISESSHEFEAEFPNPPSISGTAWIAIPCLWIAAYQNPKADDKVVIAAIVYSVLALVLFHVLRRFLGLVKKTRMRTSRTGLVLEDIGFFGTRQNVVPIQQIEEYKLKGAGSSSDDREASQGDLYYLFIVGPNIIELHSDFESVYIHPDVPVAESRYIFAQSLQKLTNK